MAKAPTSTVKQVTVPAIVAKMPAPVSVQATPTSIIPTVSDQVEIDLGSFASMFLTQIAPAVAAGLGIGAEAVINTMPMGAIINEFIGPQVISQYVSKGLTVAEATLATANISIPAPNFIESTAASLFNSAETDLAGFLGNLVGPTITALVAKVAPLKNI